MSFNVKTGAHWERKEEMEEEDPDFAAGESKLFLNRKAQRDYRINEMYRRRARKEFEKAQVAEEEEGKSEVPCKPEPVDKTATDDEEEDEKKKLKRRKVC